MNISKHNQLKALATAFVLGSMALSVSAEDNKSQSEVIVATPVTGVLQSEQQVQNAEKGGPRLFSRNFASNVSQKKSSAPLYRSNGKVKNDLATRLTDPQRKESPIRTARLFKIQFMDAPTLTSTAGE